MASSGRDEVFQRDVAAAAGTMPVIEQAKGALSLYRCASPELAFTELVRVSQQHNFKLVRVAEAVMHFAAGRRDLVDDPAVLEAIAEQWPGLGGDNTKCNRR